MKTTLAIIAGLSVMASMAQAQTPVFEDNFNSTNKNAAWNFTGGGMLNGSTLLLTNFGGGFASFWSSNAVGLNAASGQVSFKVTQSDTNTPLAFNFSVGATNVFTQQSMGRADFLNSGPGIYELVWNNTSSNVPYSLATGGAGTLSSGRYILAINGSVGSELFPSASAFTPGNDLPANAFGFWNGNNLDAARIDDFKIYNTTEVASTVPPPSEFLVYEDFTNSLALNPTYWNLGGGFFLDTNAQQVLLSTFGGGWGSRGDGSGASGLNSTVGYASFVVKESALNPIGGNFIVTHNVNFNTADALVNVPFATGGAGLYEVLWNNSGTTEPFTMPLSGWAGTIGGTSTVWIVNGNTADAHWASATNAPNVDPGEAANRWGFWINSAAQNAIIDNVRIIDSLTPGVTTCAAPTLSIVQSGGNLDISFASEASCSYQLQEKSPITGAWSDLYAPVAGDGTTKTLPVTNNGTQQYFRVIIP